MFREILQRYQTPALLGLALLLPLASIYQHGKLREQSTPVERALLRLTAPAQQTMDGLLARVVGAIDGYVLLVSTKEQNEALERENRVLLGEALRSRQLRGELERVKALCGFRETRRELQTVPARVIGRDVSQFFRVVRLQLDVEGLEQVREGQAVVTHDGVVGRIERLSGPWADVMLVTDSRSQIHATVTGKGVVGTVQGEGKRREFSARFVYLERADRRAPLAQHDAVVTTGHDRVFPAGLEIGHVAEVEGRRDGPYHAFTLTPAVTAATLEEVLIVIDERAAPAEAGAAPAPAPRKPPRIDPANTPDG
jgi:rod shape-determining protein MreC